MRASSACIPGDSASQARSQPRCLQPPRPTAHSGGDSQNSYQTGIRGHELFQVEVHSQMCPELRGRHLMLFQVILHNSRLSMFYSHEPLRRFPR